MSFGVYKEKIKTDIFEYKKQKNRKTASQTKTIKFQTEPQKT